MGKLLNGYIMPHPPVLLPEIGNGRERAALSTFEAVVKVAKKIKIYKPDTIIISSPHSPCFSDYFFINEEEVLSGDFASFGAAEISLSFDNDKTLAEEIAKIAKEKGFAAGALSNFQKISFGLDDKLDHGVLVPLYFVQKEFSEFKVVCISTPFMKMEEIYEFGKCIEKAVSESDKNVVYIASGDLSHRLTSDAPAGYNKKGKEYDEFILDNLTNGNVDNLIKVDQDFLQMAGECGTRSILMMLGAFSNKDYKMSTLSYEGPFGVGYLVAEINDVHENNTEKTEDEYVNLAKKALEMYILENKFMKDLKGLSKQLTDEQAGVFVSIKKNGELRGCIGTIEPTQKNIGLEIVANAISSGTKDPRFPKVEAEELSELTYSVDVLGKPEKINSMEELDVKKYGVIVSADYRRGLLLPDLEGIDSPELQVAIALQKAGINISENYSLERFEVIRHR